VVEAGSFSGDFVINVPRNLEFAKNRDRRRKAYVSLPFPAAPKFRAAAEVFEWDDIGGTIDAETGGGTIDVGTVGSDVNVRTGGGNIKIASAKGKTQRRKAAVAAFRLSPACRERQWRLALATSRWKRCQGTVSSHNRRRARRGSRRYREAP